MASTPAEPRRLRWSVPAADVSSNRWLDEQENISRSLQLLIRESIQRDGYIDVVNRPIDQLPRRGRPPADAGAERSDEHSDAGAATDGATSARSASGSPAQAGPAVDARSEEPEKPEERTSDQRPETTAATAPAQVEVTPAPDPAPAEPQPQPETAAPQAPAEVQDQQAASPSSSSGQQDMDDIFGHG